MVLAADAVAECCNQRHLIYRTSPSLSLRCRWTNKSRENVFQECKRKCYRVLLIEEMFFHGNSLLISSFGHQRRGLPFLDAIPWGNFGLEKRKGDERMREESALHA